MLGLRKFAVTGGFASGKSTVCKILEEYGAYVIDADEIVRQLLTQESPIGQQVIKLLGAEVLTNHQIDRKKISNIVFSNPSKLKALESIVHPAVRRAINERFEALKDSARYRFFVAEVPLLYEAGMEDEFEAVIAVVADENTARKRASSAEEFDRRSRYQLPLAAKEAQATHVIKNQGSLASLKEQVAALIPQLLI
jgi:dephospho-CoA kinase